MTRIVKTIILFSIFVFNLYFCSKAKAVTITIDSSPISIDSTNSYQVSASIYGATDATNYLRVDLFKENTTNYFGETYNGSDWYSGSDGKSYLPVQILNSSASATITFQIGNPNIKDYPCPGNYKLKIRRYTGSGNSAASTDSESSADVQITYVFPTSTPTLTPTSTPTQTPTSTPSKTPTPTPTKTPAPSPPKTLTPKPSPTGTPDGEVSTDSGDILGVETELESPTPDPGSNPNPILENKNKIIAIGFICLGILLIGGSVYFAFKTPKSSGI